jgi:hypothetical protein
LVVEQGLIRKISFSRNVFDFLSIENFIKSLIEYHHPGLEPLLMNEKGSIIIESNYSSNPDNIYILFYNHRYEKNPDEVLMNKISFSIDRS